MLEDLLEEENDLREKVKRLEGKQQHLLKKVMVITIFILLVPLKNFMLALLRGIGSQILVVHATWLRMLITFLH